jgi:nitric oxide reductase subunit C
LSEQEIDDVIVFLDWISRIDTQGWPPRPILVSGAAIPGTQLATADPLPQSREAAAQRQAAAPGASAASADPIAQGQALFNQPAPGCFACHSVSPGVNLAGPSLAGVAQRATQMIKDGTYKGAASDAAGYIRESIVDPHAYVVPGPRFSANGRSFMPDQYGKTLKPEQIDELVAYLSTLQ